MNHLVPNGTADVSTAILDLLPRFAVIVKATMILHCAIDIYAIEGLSPATVHKR